ncbi:FixH family protein [Polycladidibacter hongkongensis]|uniref:FixH family protein n=1 Tax=Polycladidibacter hongkongensis TaxID=1647556 RepID=UPI00082D83D9|nr:FixH family protein [Pseudovibrio hongkongensis]
MAQATPAHKPKRITGRHVLLCFLAFFGVIFAMNGLMMYLAIGSFPGLEVKSSYAVSQRYNDEIAIAKQQNAANWQVDLATSYQADASLVLNVQLASSEGAPQSGREVVINLHRPGTDVDDRRMNLSEGASGAYSGVIPNVDSGNWIIIMDVLNAEGMREYRSRNRVFFKQG